MNPPNNNGRQPPGQPEFERITPAQVRPGAPAADAQARKTGAGRSVSAMVVAVALALLLTLIAGVFLWLPGATERRPEQASAAESADAGAPVSATQASAQPQAPTQGQPDPPDAEALLAQREQAQTLLDALATRQTRLQARAVTRWAQTEFAEIRDAHDQAQTAFEARQYQQAKTTAESAIEQADKLLARADTEYAEAMARGRDAYAQRKAAPATAAFEQAAAISPDDSQAKDWLARAEVLDEVLAQMRAGRDAEDDNDLAGAEQAYRKAVERDGQFDPARKALARVRASRAGQQYAGAMSRGLAALEAGDWAGAQAAFNQARKLRPSSNEAADGLARARAGLEQQRIGAARNAAEAAVADEDWAKAVAAYDKALKVDASLAFAQAGKARAERRLALDRKLAFHLDHRQRLSDAAVRDDAAALLGQARSVAEPGPRLRRQISELDRLIAAMRQPVAVHLRSDNRTQVLVYHVGKLGRFEQKSLDLTPGEYTVVGRCDGYRDVRRTIDVPVKAGSIGPITIVCNEKI